MSDSLTKQILDRQQELEADRQPWESLWQDIADYVIPRREDINQQAQKGFKQGLNIYDNTALEALNMFAAGLQGYTASPSIEWFRLKMADKDLNDIPEIKQWLQDTQEVMRGEFASSNFYDQMTPFFQDGGSIGTAFLYSEERIDDDRIMFSCRHPGECYLDEDAYGNVDTLFRKFELTARQAVQRFDEDRLSASIKRMAKETPRQKREFIHACFPRTDRNITRLDNRNMAFASVYVEKNADSRDGANVVHESGYNSFPYAVWRYMKNSNERYGRSPACDALVDIMGANTMSKSILRAAHMSIDPPLNVPSELKDETLWRPGARNYYNKERRVVTPAHTGISYPIGTDREERKQQAIRKHFHVDFWMMLANAERQMTAREVIERTTEKAMLMGPAVGRLHSGCFNPVIDRFFELLWNAGKIPQPPDALMEQAGASIDVEYVGPLAMAQQYLYTGKGIVQGLEAIAPVVALFPDAADIVDASEAARSLLEAHNFPQKALRSRDDVDRMRQERVQAEMEAQQQEEMLQGAQGLKAVADADKASGGQISQAVNEMAGA